MYGVGPSLTSSYVVVLARSCQGHLFLVCGCYRYAQQLMLCAHMWKAKSDQCEYRQDIHFRYHSRYNLLSKAHPGLPRSADEGRTNGPGVAGIPDSELQAALADLPDARTSVDAAELEGCFSWSAEPIIRSNPHKNSHNNPNHAGMIRNCTIHERQQTPTPNKPKLIS
jgi:hypothetical protein